MNPILGTPVRPWCTTAVVCLGFLLIAVLAGAGEADTWTLERAITCAVANNPDARIAAHRIAAAHAAIEQANSSLWPHLQLHSGYTYTDNPVAVFAAILNQRAYSQSLDFNDVPNADNLNLSGTVTMTLYAGGQVVAGRRAAQANLAAAAATADAVRDALSLETARMFFTILKTRDLIRAAEASVASFERNLSIATGRVESGSALKTEALDMQVRLAQARENLVRVRNARALAEQGLRTLLAIEAGAVIIVDSPPPLAVPVDTQDAQRPELVAVREQQRAAEAEVRRAAAGYQPRVNALASLDYNRGWELDGDGASYGAGVVAEWDLWDGRLTHGRISEARARLAAAKEEERKLRLAIDLEIEQARLQLEEAVERLSVTAASIAQAEESADLTRIRFEQGRATSTQVIDAETALTTARFQRVGAIADRDIAIAALRKALGLPLLESSVVQ